MNTKSVKSSFELNALCKKGKKERERDIYADSYTVNRIWKHTYYMYNSCSTCFLRESIVKPL